ncbi:DUF6894 family protein [Microvirga arabica]|uniref:DUF6894 family protein n=1 Tax=Microvirga arabica TaxID=1128671 RepID=UPI00193A104C|nr:hypothetical protein [Microvirga arabica]MBM1169644.1 hypothetical protein [Microvirga arabica]
MPQYILFVCNQHNRIKYPESFDLPDIEAAHDAARRVAKVFMEVVPYWRDLPPDQKDEFRVEIVDEAGERLLTVPFKEPEQGEPHHGRRGDEGE